MAVLLLTLLLCVSLVACGSAKQDAINAYNEANITYTELALQVNADPSMLEDVDLETLKAIGEDVVYYKALLESGEELTDEAYGEIISWSEYAIETVEEINEAYGLTEE